MLKTRGRKDQVIVQTETRWSDIQRLIKLRHAKGNTG